MFYYKGGKLYKSRIFEKNSALKKKKKKLFSEFFSSPEAAVQEEQILHLKNHLKQQFYPANQGYKTQN